MSVRRLWTAHSRHNETENTLSFGVETSEQGADPSESVTLLIHGSFDPLNPRPLFSLQGLGLIEGHHFFDQMIDYPL